MQELNLKRCSRLDGLFQLETSQLPTAEAAPADPGPASPSGTNSPTTVPGGDPADEAARVEAQRQQLELAAQLLHQVTVDIGKARDLLHDGSLSSAADAVDPPGSVGLPGDALSEPDGIDPGVKRGPMGDVDDSSSSDTGALSELGSAVDRSITTLEELRRLFFSLVEHLRDTARRQANLNDDTTKIAADGDVSQRPRKTGPVALRQQQLTDIAQQIAEALQQQAGQARAAAAGQAESATNPKDPNSPDAAAAAETLARAASLVDEAQNSMRTAAEQLSAIAEEKNPPTEPFAQPKKSQTQSLQKLVEALALLDENSPQHQQQQNQRDQDQQKQQQEEQNQQREQQQLDDSQLLQMIRDREAERRKDRQRRAASSGAPVDKDW